MQWLELLHVRQDIWQLSYFFTAFPAVGSMNLGKENTTVSWVVEFDIYIHSVHLDRSPFTLHSIC